MLPHGLAPIQYIVIDNPSDLWPENLRPQTAQPATLSAAPSVLRCTPPSPQSGRWHQKLAARSPGASKVGRGGKREPDEPGTMISMVKDHQSCYSRENDRQLLVQFMSRISVSTWVLIQKSSPIIIINHHWHAHSTVRTAVLVNCSGSHRRDPKTRRSCQVGDMKVAHQIIMSIINVLYPP